MSRSGASYVAQDTVVISVRDHGAVGDQTTDDTAAINAAVATAPTGSCVTFPLGTFGTGFKISAPITGKTGVSYLGRGRAKVPIVQATQYQAAFDLFNVDNCHVEGFALSNAAAPPGTGPSFRGDAGYAFSCGVWTNGNRHKITNVKITNFGMAINLNSSDGVTNVGNHAKRTGNVVSDVEIVGANHGVVMLNQDQAYISNVNCHDHIDSTAGGNPMHAVYVTGTDIDRSTNLTIEGCRDTNNSTGQAFQIKYTYGLVLSDCQAVNCFGLFNAVDLFDADISDLLSTADTHTSGSFTIQKGTNQPARIDANRITISKAVDANAEVILGCDDSTFTKLTLRTLKNGLNIAGSDVSVRGNRVTVDGIKMRNTGSSSARAIIVGNGAGYPTSDVTVKDFEIDGYRNLVDLDPTITGQNVIQFNPAAQRRIVFGTSQYVSAVSGTPPYSIQRAHSANVYQVAGAGTQYPLGGLETLSFFNVTTAAAFTMNAPIIAGNATPIGLIQEVAIKNATAGALGVITWAAAYAWKSGSAPAAPAAGITQNWRFMWDGTNWREI